MARMHPRIIAPHLLCSTPLSDLHDAVVMLTGQALSLQHSTTMVTLFQDGITDRAPAELAIARWGPPQAALIAKMPLTSRLMFGSFPDSSMWGTQSEGRMQHRRSLGWYCSRRYNRLQPAGPPHLHTSLS